MWALSQVSLWVLRNFQEHAFHKKSYGMVTEMFKNYFIAIYIYIYIYIYSNKIKGKEYQNLSTIKHFNIRDALF